jgi:UTP-glucose-1-phosphate uridylyltransferase
MHPNGRHSAAECREIIDLAKCVSVRREQSSGDGSPPRRRPGKDMIDNDQVAVAEPDLGYQSPEEVLKDVLPGGSNSGDDN